MSFDSHGWTSSANTVRETLLVVQPAQEVKCGGTGKRRPPAAASPVTETTWKQRNVEEVIVETQARPPQDVWSFGIPLLPQDMRDTATRPVIEASYDLCTMLRCSWFSSVPHSKWNMRAGVAQSVQCLTTEWTTGVRSPGEVRIRSSSLLCPDQLSGPPSLLSNG
jgi:hypothetical protein